MRLDVVDLFPTPLGVYQWDSEKHNDLKKVIRELINEKNPDTSPGINDIYHFWNNSGESLLDEQNSIIREFSTFLSDSYIDYTQNVFKYDMTTEHFITECWVNVTRKNGWQYKHSHSNCFVSGTYYLNFPPGSTGLSFSSSAVEKTAPYLTAPPKEQSKYNSSSLTMMPEESILFLWPSNLTHETKILTEDVRRVTVSMNFVPAELDTGIYHLRLSR